MGISGHHALLILSTAPDVSLHTGIKRGDRRSPLVRTMEQASIQIKKKQKAIQRDYLSAFFGRDERKLEAIRSDALSLGMCINKDNLCGDDRCYCRN